MPIEVKPAPRQISIRRPNTVKPVTLTQSAKETQERYFVRLVERNPQYKMIVSSIRDGITPSAIAAYFAEQGWIDVNERTFTEAIRTFKRVRPEALLGRNEGLSEHVNPNQPSMSEEAVLQQLIRLQQERLALTFKLEKDTGFTMGTTYRDVEAAGNLVERLAKIRGKLTETGKSTHPVGDAAVHEDLNKVRKSDQTADRLHGLVKQIVSAG